MNKGFLTTNMPHFDPFFCCCEFWNIKKVEESQNKIVHIKFCQNFKKNKHMSAAILWSRPFCLLRKIKKKKKMNLFRITASWTKTQNGSDFHVSQRHQKINLCLKSFCN